jgi:hypothetical protein
MEGATLLGPAPVVAIALVEHSQGGTPGCEESRRAVEFRPCAVPSKDLGDVQAGNPTGLQPRTEGRPFAIPSSRNLLAPEGVQAPEEFFQASEG